MKNKNIPPKIIPKPKKELNLEPDIKRSGVNETEVCDKCGGLKHKLIPCICEMYSYCYFGKLVMLLKMIQLRNIDKDSLYSMTLLSYIVHSRQGSSCFKIIYYIGKMALNIMKITNYGYRYSRK